MRLGGPIFSKPEDPQQWARAVRAKGWRAAYCPINETAGAETIAAYAAAAREHDIVISEVGAWLNNPLSLDEATRRAAVAAIQKKLAFAEAIGARCCVNIAGSRVGAEGKWDAPAEGNLSEEAFDLIVTTAREIIDAVKPVRTAYALETMPYTLPDSPESYLRIFEAVDRKGFAVHFDPVNMINSPRKYWANAAFLRECVRLLGPHIRTVHAKDIILEHKLTVHLNETRPGLGRLDYATLLTELNRLDPDLPVMLEHMTLEADYDTAAAHVRAVAASVGVRV